MLLALLSPLLPSVHAFPMSTWPECGTPDRLDLCPPDMGQDWALLSWVPSAWQPLVRPEELLLGTGLGADRAWRSTAGRTDVVIAVLDSGIMWDDGSLLKKHWLNRSELPLPMIGETVAADWDANGDGVFNIDDWAQDSRVDMAAGRDQADGVLDPSDLIYTFSDGVDDDGNGYIDDISGWDFFFNDNDPYDDTRFDHGTYEVQESMRPGDDGDGIGVCPNCMAMSLRVGDSFVAEGDNFANAALYATDNGAAVIQEALGTYTNSRLAMESISYAWDRGVTVVGSAADETAWHPNPPGMNPKTIYVHAVVFNGDGPEESESFLSYSNCTNHGARLDLSAPSQGCSSGAAAMTAGTVGLMISAAREAGLTGELALTPGEIYQLLVGTADDIAIDGEVGGKAVYPTWTGWDSYSGHGRIAAWRAVEAIVAGEIPPVAELTAPEWYAYVDPDVGTGGAGGAGPVLRVEGLVTAARSGSVRWRLEAAYGLEPAAADMVTLAEGSGAVGTTPGGAGGASAGGLLTEIPMADLLAALPALDPAAAAADYVKGATPVDREAAVNRWTVSLRLTAVDAEGREAVARRTVMVRRDPDMVAGWPVAVGSSMEGSPKIADLDGDGAEEVIIVDADGRVHALKGDGTELAGWPVRTEVLEEVDPSNPASHLDAAAWSVLDGERHAAAVGTPAVGDLDGDGGPEVIVTTIRGSVWVYGADGGIRAGFPVQADPVVETDPDRKVDDGFMGGASLGDFDGDGALEIAAGAMDGQVYIWEADGSRMAGWPVRLQFPGHEDREARLTVGLAVGDLDGDGRDDIVTPSNEVLDDTHAALYAVSGTGAMLPGWPVDVFGILVDALPLVGQGFHGPVALGDIDGDGALEAFGGALAGDFTIWNADGTERDLLPYASSAFGAGSNANDASFIPLMTIPIMGDIDGDAVPDLIAGGSGIDYATGLEKDGERVDFDHMISVWSGATGAMLPGFPRVVEDLQFLLSPAAADIDGDGRVEVITGSGGFVLHAWNADGAEPAGWPKVVGQWIMPSPAVGDLDGDGALEIVTATRSGSVFAWRTGGRRDGRVDWNGKGHDPHNTHNMETPLDGYAGPSVAGAEPDKVEEDGCGCSSGGSGGSGGAGLIGLTGLMAAAAIRRGRGGS